MMRHRRTHLRTFVEGHSRGVVEGQWVAVSQRIKQRLQFRRRGQR